MKLLDNIFWNTLTGAHARHAVGSGGARRYARGFSAIIGFADATRPDFASLSAHCEPSEQLYCDDWSGEAPADWRIVTESRMFKMVWEGTSPEVDPAPDATALGREHAAQALELAELTKPGPFALRTIELGEYFGYFAGPRLIAMAGERTHAGRWREISGVCTHPDVQGRGLANRLVRKLILRQQQRAQQPFLHVMHDNLTARALYRRLGFRDYRETVVRVVSRSGLSE